jgi:hypothetical protein
MRPALLAFALAPVKHAYLLQARQMQAAKRSSADAERTG